MISLRIRGLIMPLTAAIAIMAVVAPATAESDYPESGENATSLLSLAAETMQSFNSYRFLVTYEEGKTTVYDRIKVSKIKGEIVRPGYLKADVEAKLSRLSMDLHVTSRDGNVNVDAIGVGGDVSVGSDVQELLSDPTRFIVDAAAAISNPVVTEIETTDSGSIIWIQGVFDPDQLADSALAAFTQDMGTRPVDIGIDDWGRIVSVRVPGPFVSNDSNDVVRRIDFYDFNQVVASD